MKAKRQTEVVLISATMLDGFGGHVNTDSYADPACDRPARAQRWPLRPQP